MELQAKIISPVINVSVMMVPVDAAPSIIVLSKSRPTIIPEIKSDLIIVSRLHTRICFIFEGVVP